MVISNFGRFFVKPGRVSSEFPAEFLALIDKQGLRTLEV